MRIMPINTDLVPLIAALLAVETKRSVFIFALKTLTVRLKLHLSGDRRWSFFLSEPFPVAASVSCFLLLGTCGDTLDSLSCTILLLTTACKICCSHIDEKINPESCSSFKHFASSDELVLRLSSQHVHHQPHHRFSTSRNFHALSKFPRRFWWELTCLICGGTSFSSYP